MFGYCLKKRCTVKNCAECDEDGNCTLCEPGMFRINDENGIQCVANCPQDYFINWDHRECL